MSVVYRCYTIYVFYIVYTSRTVVGCTKVFKACTYVHVDSCVRNYVVAMFSTLYALRYIHWKGASPG